MKERTRLITLIDLEFAGLRPDHDKFFRANYRIKHRNKDSSKWREIKSIEVGSLNPNVKVFEKELQYKWLPTVSRLSAPTQWHKPWCNPPLFRSTGN